MNDLLRQAREALHLAMTICDRVPTRWHLLNPTAHPAEHDIGCMVNAQDNGAHGYAVIRDALAALDAALAAPVAQPWILRQVPLTDSQIDAVLSANGLHEPTEVLVYWEVARAIERAHGIGLFDVLERKDSTSSVVESETPNGSSNAASPQPVAPAGWRLVPEEPDGNMRLAADQYACSTIGRPKGLWWFANIYRAMIAAAPQFTAAPKEAPRG